MTLAEAGEVFRYWEDNPPAHLMVQAIARLLGWSPSPPGPGSTPLADLTAAPPPGLTVAHGGNLGMPPAILDPDTLRTRNQARAAERARTYCPDSEVQPTSIPGLSCRPCASRDPLLSR